MGTCGVFLETLLRGHLEAHVTADLAQKVRCARDMLALAGDGSAAAQMAIGWRLAESLEARLTLLSDTGELIWDSNLEDDKQERHANHRGRREVDAALAGAPGTARRTSSTLAVPMLYSALPFQGPRASGIVRVAISLAEVDSAIGRMRWLIACAGLFGLALAICAGGLASLFARRALGRLAAHTRAVFHDGQRQRLPLASLCPTPAGPPPPAVAGRRPSWEHTLTDELQRVVSILGRERDQFRAILSSMQEAVLAVGGDGALTLINAQARAWLDLPAPRLGAPIDAQLASQALCALLLRARSQPGVREELSIKDRQLVACTQPLPEHGGGSGRNTAAGTVVVMHDITGLRHLEATRRDFVANVSHELRTPVTIMRANAETLLSGALHDPRAAHAFAAGLLRGAVRLGEIIDDLLAISRAEAGQLELSPGRLAWRKVVMVAKERVAQSAAARGVTVNIQGGERLWLHVDGRAVSQVLVNLLDNAIKHGRRGGQVVVGAHVQEQAITTWVADDGPGIPAVHQDRIFERFYRVAPPSPGDGEPVEARVSTGLGLSIVKHFCEAMGGEAGIEVGRPRGALVWCRLPRARGAKVVALTSAQHRPLSASG